MRLVLVLCCLIGLVVRVNGVIDWAAAIAAAGAASSAVISGGSLLGNLAGAPGYAVVCTIEVENWTKYPLMLPEARNNGGIIKSPPVVVLPGQKEQFIAHKTGHTATGTFGTASWLISSARKRAVVMWSCPYSFDFHSNWLGVGLTDRGCTDHRNWYGQMYYRSSGGGLNFRRGEYYYHTRTISIRDSEFEVVGIMGTSHKANVRIIVRPRELRDLADNLRTGVRNLL
nr:mytiporin 2 [Mytilus galloprovincialis]